MGFCKDDSFQKNQRIKKKENRKRRRKMRRAGELEFLVCSPSSVFGESETEKSLIFSERGNGNK
jgi:hypothetical protein